MPDLLCVSSNTMEFFCKFSTLDVVRTKNWGKHSKSEKGFPEHGGGGRL